MDRRVWSLAKIVLYVVELYFVYLSFHVVLYAPQYTYVVLRCKWDEATDKCFEGGRKIVMTELKKSDNVREFILDIDKIVKPTEQKRMNNVHAPRSDQLLKDVAGESLPHDNPRQPVGQQVHADLKQSVEPQMHGDVKQPVEEQVHGDDDVDVSGAGEDRELSTDFVQERLTTLADIMDQFVEYDVNFDRSSKARQSVIEAVSCYGRLLAQREKQKQKNLEKFIAIIRQKILSEVKP